MTTQTIASKYCDSGTGNETWGIWSWADANGGLVADDPDGFILRQGWTGLDFRDEQQVAQLRKLLESLELEILSVIEAMNRLRESPEFELHELIAINPAMFERVFEKRSRLLELECPSGQRQRQTDCRASHGIGKQFTFP